jgi:nucleoside-diphosphate-sugar epimerase
MKRVIITGGTGFVGANLARHLLALGHELHLLIRPQSKLWRIQDIQADLRLHQVSLLDEQGLAKLMPALRPDWIFHLAVYGAYSSQQDQAQILGNISSTAHLVQAALKTDFECFINTGSSSEYGYKDHPPHEQTWLDPNSYYAISKAAATLYCRHTALAHKRPITTLRLYSVYGPYEEPGRLLPTLIKAGLQGQLPPLVSPDTARDFVYIEDVLRAYVAVAESPTLEPGEVLNIGSGHQTTLAEAVRVARQHFGLTIEPQWGSMSARQWDTTTWVADASRARQVLGWQAELDFPAGFAKMSDWFKEHQALYDN